jgi:RNA recognition motif-containing protein
MILTWTNNRHPVGNLSYNATEDDLRQAFSQFGDVSSGLPPL